MNPFQILCFLYAQMMIDDNTSCALFFISDEKDKNK